MTLLQSSGAALSINLMYPNLTDQDPPFHSYRMKEGKVAAESSTCAERSERTS